MVTRGALGRYSERKTWLLSTLAFSALHAPNVLFGLSVGAMLAQLVLTFIVGSLLWATRRLSGTLWLCIFLHGFWDSSIFLPRATDVDPFALSALIYPIAIVAVVAVVRRTSDSPA
jgi:uncharacterized protein